MPRLQLSGALIRSAFTEPLLAGQVEVQGVDVIWSALDPGELFWRQLTFADFDVSEMSLASFAISHDRGGRTWRALPVFTHREFFHTRLTVRADSAIDDPRQLRGGRVGLAEYQQTAAVWCRGVLEHRFGVATSEITWVMERPAALSHGGATGFTPPQGVSIETVAPGDNIWRMLADVELDAVLWRTPRRNLVDVADRPHVATRPLFRDAVAEEVDYYTAESVLPANHCVVIREALLAEHPWLALNVYTACQAAKQVALTHFREIARRSAFSGAQVDRLTALDPVPYGLRSQTPMLNTLFTYLKEQGLTGSVPTVAELFAAQTAAV